MQKGNHPKIFAIHSKVSRKNVFDLDSRSAVTVNYGNWLRLLNESKSSGKWSRNNAQVMLKLYNISSVVFATHSRRHRFLVSCDLCNICFRSFLIVPSIVRCFFDTFSKTEICFQTLKSFLNENDVLQRRSCQATVWGALPCWIILSFYPATFAASQNKLLITMRRWIFEYETRILNSFRLIQPHGELQELNFQQTSAVWAFLERWHH